MGLLDSLKNIFKPNVGSDAEPSSWASPSTYSNVSTIPLAKPSTTSSASTASTNYKDVAKQAVSAAKSTINDIVSDPVVSSALDKAETYAKTTKTQPKVSTIPVKQTSTRPAQEEKKLVTASSQGESRKAFEYDRTSDKLSARAHRNGLAAGEDYEHISNDQREYIDTYYNTLDRAEITKPYLELEQLVNGTSFDDETFNAKYQALMDYIDEELKAERKQNGATSKQYRALEQVKEDVSALGRQYSVNSQYAKSNEYSKNLDEGINAIFAGVMNSSDYGSTVNSGRQAVSEDAKAKKWFDSHMANASETQRNLMYYTYQKEGLAGVKEMFNDYMGEALNYFDASKDFISDIVDNPDKGGRFWEINKANWSSALDGQWWGGTKQTFTNTEADPDDHKLVGDYQIADAIDYGLRQEIGELANDPNFAYYGNTGFTAMRENGIGGDWLKDAQTNASTFQKQVLGYVYLSNDGDSEIVRDTWESIKQQGESIWEAVNSNTLPTRASSLEGQMYRDYLGMSGSKTPGFLSSPNDDGNSRVGQVIWDLAQTTRAQYPQILANAAVTAALSFTPLAPIATVAGRVAGGAVMSASAYGNAYKETRDAGYDKKSASGYAAANAASEFVTDFILSGLGPAPGILENAASKQLIKNIANPVARALTDLGMRTFGEGAQEYIQEIGDPLLRNLFLGENNGLSLYSDEARYNFFMGAFSAATMSNPSQVMRTAIDNAKLGKALNMQGSTQKIVDTIFNSKLTPETKAQQDALSEAKETAQKIKDGKVKASDVNIGEMTKQFGQAGGDLTFLTNPETVSYTKEQISVADMRAGAVSRLATIGGDTSLAEDVAKMAKGEDVTEETRSKVSKDAKATQVLQELQGDLNMEENNALTIAARMSTVEGTMAKISAAVQQNNPDNVILTPAEQYLSEQGVGLADSRRIGGVINKVLDGETITKDEAKLVRVKSPAIQAAVLTQLGIELHESATTDMILAALNEKAAEMARVKDMQAGVRNATKSAAQNIRRNPNAAAQAGVGVPSQAAGGTGAQAGTAAVAAQGSNPDVGGSTGVGSAGAGAPQAGRAGQVRKGNGGAKVGRNASVRGPGRVIPVNKLSDEQRSTQRRLASNGFGSVSFITGSDSYTKWNEKLGCYEVGIRADGYFSTDQYADHETGHLWIKALSVADKKSFLYMVQQAFGKNFKKAFAQTKEKYIKIGAFEEDVADTDVVEELYCFARGGQNFSKSKDSIMRFDFSQYHDAVMQIEQMANLEAMAMGDLSNEQVRQNYESGNFNREYYERQGYLDEDVAPATEAKTEQTPKAEAKTEEKSEKSKKSKPKKATIPAKSEADRLREHYEQRKAAQTRKFEQGKLKITTRDQLNRRLEKLDNELQQKLEELADVERPTRKNPDHLTVTPEAIARAEKLSEETRNDLLSELEGLQTELKSDRSIANNMGYLTRVKAWFDKANAAIREANGESQTTAETEVSPEEELNNVASEYRGLVEQARENPELMNDGAFLQRMQALEERVNALDERTAAAEAAVENQEATAEEAPFDYDTQFRQLTEDYVRRRASQRRKTEKNPSKSDESFNAKLKKIQDDYEYKVQALRAEARRRGDPRFSAEPTMEDANGRKENTGAAAQRDGVRSASKAQIESWGPESYAAEYLEAQKNTEVVSGGADEKRVKDGYLQAGAKDFFVNEGGWIVEENEVPQSARNAGRIIQTYLPNCNVTYFYNPESDTVAAFIDGKTSMNDGGIFINAAAFDDPDLMDALAADGVDLNKAVSHEIAHYLLYYASASPEDYAAGTRAIEAYRFVAKALQDSPDLADDAMDALDYAYEEYADLYYDASEEKVVEELIADIFAGVDRMFEGDEEVFDLLNTLVRQYFVDATEFGNIDEAGRALFSVDPDEDIDVEELMDRTDEMRSDERDAQIWQDASLNEEEVAAPAEDYDAQMDALMAELDAHPESSEEIFARMEALQNERDSTKALKEEPAKPQAKARATVIPPKTETVKAEPVVEAKPEPVKEKSAAAKAFQPKAEKTKPAPVNDSATELKKPELHRGENPVDVKGLDKKKAISKVTQEKAAYESWYAQEKGKLDKLYDDKKLEDAKYAKEFSKLTERRNKDIGRYNDQLKRLEAMEEAPVKEKATVIKDNEITYTPQTGEWWKRIKNGSDIQIRRLRSDRNTYDVRFTDSRGNQVVYSEVSPSRLEMALGEKLKSKLDAKTRLAGAFDSATSSLGEWQAVDNTKPVEVKVKAAKPDRTLDNYGRKIPVKLSQRMANTTVRDSAGRLLSVYRLGPANGVRNANPNAKFTLWSERPATMNLMRGLNEAAAYDQTGKRVGANIENWLQELADHPQMSEGNKNVIRAKIAAAERKMREFTTHVTRLDPWRPGYTNPKREDVIGNHTLLEGYVDIRSPLVIDAKGKGLDFVRDTAMNFANDPANLANQVDVDGNPLGEHDGIKFINVTVTDGDKSLGGGPLDRDTLYVTFRSNQGKSTYNTDPTDSELMQYAADPDSETGYAEGTLEDTILKIMRDKDEDHAIESLALYLSQFLQTGVLPEMENERTRNIFQRQVGPAEQAFLRQRAAELIDKYGRLEQGENPARDVAFPKRTEDGNIRRVFRTAAESKNTPERAVPVITREAMTRDGATYQTITDKSAIAAADRDMRHKGFNQMLAEWRAKADGNVEGIGSISKYDIAKAEMLYIEAVKVGDMETAMQTLAELAEVGTTAGQVVQAMRMLKSMPKSYQLYYMRRVVNRMNQQYAKRINSGRMSELTIRKELAQAVLKAQSQEELDTAMEALINDVASQIPATIGDKWNAWRYLSMLGNPKTHIRNILGNAIFMPAKFSKDLIAAGLEGMFIRDRSQRRTSIKGVLGRNTDYREFAQNDYEGIKDELQSGGKYNPANEIMDARTIFKSKTLEFLRKFNGEKLEQEDGLFLRAHYVNALTNFLATQGMSVKDLTTTKQGQKILNAARLYAFNEAQKATYRDASRFASALNQMKRDSGPIGLLLEGIFPFTKTPINILKRGIEYSPVGLLKSLFYDATRLKNGEISANDFIDNLASGLTGTGIAALGMWLASMGILRGGGDDDDKQDDFDTLQGYQSYSINIGKYNYTIDWTAPTALPLFVGCEIFNQLREGGNLSSADFINALSVIAEPITQLSMLSGLNETLKSAKWDDNPTSSIIMSMGSGYITQALPTLVAQISRSLTADRRTTYVNKNSDVPQPIQRWWQTNVLGKTPLNSQRTEYIDAWGRKDTTSSFTARLVENLFSPGYLNRIKTTAVDSELQKLADRVGTSVLMTVPERSIEYSNTTYQLTAGQYAKYAKTRGDAAMHMLSDLFASDGYQNEMSDSEKATAVKNVKDYANVLGKQSVFPDYDPTTDNWAEKCDGDPTRLTNMALLKAQAHEQGITAGNNSGFYAMILGDTWLTPVDQAYAIAQQYSTGSSTYIYEKKGGPKYELTAERKQILAEHFRQVFPAYYVDLASSEKWLSANIEEKVDLLSDARAQANADTKAWLAHILAQQGAETFNP